MNFHFRSPVEHRKSTRGHEGPRGVRGGQGQEGPRGAASRPRALILLDFAQFPYQPVVITKGFVQFPYHAVVITEDFAQFPYQPTVITKDLGQFPYQPAENLHKRTTRIPPRRVKGSKTVSEHEPV